MVGSCCLLVFFCFFVFGHQTFVCGCVGCGVWILCPHVRVCFLLGLFFSTFRNLSSNQNVIYFFVLNFFFFIFRFFFVFAGVCVFSYLAFILHFFAKKSRGFKKKRELFVLLIFFLCFSLSFLFGSFGRRCISLPKGGGGGGGVLLHSFFVAYMFLHIFLREPAIGRKEHEGGGGIGTLLLLLSTKVNTASKFCGFVAVGCMGSAVLFFSCREKGSDKGSNSGCVCVCLRLRGQGAQRST